MWEMKNYRDTVETFELKIEDESVISMYAITWDESSYGKHEFPTSLYVHSHGP